MPALINKNILILSPQAWGNLYLSKHHYALELAKRGNWVFFLDPPDQSGKSSGFSVECKPFERQPGLFVVSHSLGFPYILKYKVKWLFDMLMKLHVKKLLHSVNVEFDIVWSFDIGNLYPLSSFGPGTYRIFHPVDESSSREAIRAAKDSNIIFSVTREILEKYRSIPVRKLLVNHGFSEAFLHISADDRMRTDHEIRVGFSGNLLRPDIDRGTLLDIIRSHPLLKFICFGSYEEAQSNIGGIETTEVKDFISSLRGLPNVVLRGVLPIAELAEAYHEIDVWLICYDVVKDQSKGTNYHKVMEFLSTGKVIVSNNVTAYASDPRLVTMVGSRKDNLELPELFSKVIRELEAHNSPEMQQYRRNFAASNTYASQVKRIAELIAQD